MKIIAPLVSVILSMPCVGQITYISQSRKVQASIGAVQEASCTTAFNGQASSSSDFLPASLVAHASGINGHDGIVTGISTGHAEQSSELGSDFIFCSSLTYGNDGECNCFSSGHGWGVSELIIEFEIAKTQAWWVDCAGFMGGSSMNVWYLLLEGPSGFVFQFSPALTWTPTVRETGTMPPGRYRLTMKNTGGATGTGCSGGRAFTDFYFSLQCPCAADFDHSGGTPDDADIFDFVSSWLNAEQSADTNCSGGSPDAVDLAEFFTQWLAGGC